MMIRFGGGIVEINGKDGNNIYRCDYNGQYMTPYIHRHYGPTLAQKQVRMRFFNSARFAGHVINWELHMDCWWIYSYNNPIRNKKGELRYMIPFMAATQYNIFRQRDGLPMRQCPSH